MSQLRSLRLFASLLLGSTAVSQAVTPGLDTPVPVAPYFGGVFPSTPPGDPSGWAVVNAFPNLTFTDPMMLTEIPGQNEFLVVGKTGLIWRFPKNPSATAAQRVQVLDLTAETQTSEDQGFYSLAFHPNFGQAGQTGENFVYVCYSRKGVLGVSSPDRSYWTLSRFTWLPASGTIDAASEQILISQFDPHRFHQGGALFFGNEGYLHVTVGDGGASADTFDNAQRMNMGLFAGILRIDVDYYEGKPGSHAIRRQPLDDPEWSYLGVSMARPEEWPASFSQHYGIPDDNPWQSPDGSALEEYYAVGLRSPHSAHYDPPTGDIWVGDVGQTSWEELSRVVKGSNCQWSYKEGPEASSYRFDPNILDDVETPPVYSYDHTQGLAIIGGMRYRGARWASFLAGKVIFGDHGRGRIWNVALPPGGGAPVVTEMYSSFRTGPKKGLANFSTDSEGEIYMMDLAGTNNPGGRIMKLAEPAVSTEPPATLLATGVFQDLEHLIPAPGVIPYDVPNALWSDGAHKRRWIILPNDGSFDTPAEDIDFDAEGNWKFPPGTVFVKHFEVPVDANNPSVMKRLETRFLVCTVGGGKYGFTYKWNAQGTDAELMEGGLNEAYDYDTGSGIEHRTWSYPSRGDCMVCHNDVSGQALGVRTAHLNSDAYYPATGRMANQLETFNALGMFDVTLTPSQLEDFIQARKLDDETAPLEHRVRSYLDTNCSHCHQPGASGEGFDARLATPLDLQNLVNGIPTRYEELGASGRYIAPGDPSLSAVYVRAAAAGNGDAMPPLAKNMAHAQGVAALQQYIAGLVPAEFESPPAPKARYVRFKTLAGFNRRYAAVAELAILDGEGVAIPYTELSIAGVDGEEPGALAGEAIDGKTNSGSSFWQTPNPASPAIVPDHPHFITLDLGHEREIGGFIYYPRVGTATNNGRVRTYEVHYSLDNVNWTLLDSSAQSGELVNSQSGVYTYAPGFNKRAARCQIAGPVAPVEGPFEVTTVFDMDTTEFTAADIQVTGGTVTQLRGSGYYYIARISPNQGVTEVQVTVPQNVISPEGKGSLASNSLSVVVVPDETPPGQPGNLVASPQLTQMGLAWTESQDNVAVTSYRVYRGEDEEPIATVTGTTYTDTGLDPHTEYHYRVVALDHAGNTSPEATVTALTLEDTVIPSTPQSFAGDPDMDSILLTWEASGDNVAVKEYRIISGSEVIATVQGLFYLVTGLADGTEYTYQIVAVDTSELVSHAATVTVTTDLDDVPPAAPGDLAATPDVTSIQLTWTAPEANATYRVFRDSEQIATVSGTSYNDTGLVPGTTYEYQVYALDERLNISVAATISTATVADEVAPTMPGNLDGIATMESVQLTWTASSDPVGLGVDRYRISRNSTVVGTVTSGLSFTDTGLESGIEYHYQIVAIDEAGNVSPAATLSITTSSDEEPPSAPGNLEAGPDYSSVYLTWTAATDNIGVEGYEVYRSGEETPIATVTTLAYTVTGLASNTSYTFEVKARDGEGLLSEAATVTVETFGFEDWLEENELAGELTGDSDGGGLDNFAEYRLGMDPADPLDDLTFRLELAKDAGVMQVVLPELKPVGHYHVHASNNLADILSTERRIVSLDPEAIEALPPEQREHYVVEIPVVGERKFVILVFEPTPEE